jgi:hypothetical protein
MLVHVFCESAIQLDYWHTYPPSSCVFFATFLTKNIYSFAVILY